MGIGKVKMQKSRGCEVAAKSSLHRGKRAHAIHTSCFMARAAISCAAFRRLTVRSLPSVAITANRLGATPCPVNATRAPLISGPAFISFSAAKSYSSFSFLLAKAVFRSSIASAQFDQHLAHIFIFQKLLHRRGIGLE